MTRRHRDDETKIASALAAVDEGYTIRQAAEAYDIGISTLYRYRANGSGKSALLKAIESSQPAEVAQLTASLSSDRHTTVHLIYSLQKQGLVTFVERDGAPTHIELTRRARRTDAAPSPAPDPRGNGIERRIDPPRMQLERSIESDAGRIDYLAPTPQDWPELRRITDQARAIEGALEALGDVEGLETIRQLVRDSLDQTAVEREYLRYARSHTDAGE